MKKLKELKEAIKNTSPDRLAKIEYQSHFMQMLGVTMVCGILIWKGFWWIIFAFIFSIGVSLSQFISAYQKYHAIIDIVGDTYDVKKDKSFTRKRDYIIKQVIGKWVKWVLLIFSIITSIRFIPYHTWYFKILFAVSTILIYVIFYFFIAYWAANQFLQEKKR